MATTFTPSGSTGGSFSKVDGNNAIGRVTVTTAATTSIVSFKFNVARRGLWLRIGSSAGGQEILRDRYVEPGDHLISFVPNVGTYYMEWQLRDLGNAVLSGLARVAAGNMSLPTPWTHDFQSLRSEQSLDVQWWAHPNYQTRKLIRYGTNSWSLVYFQPQNGPFDDNDTTGTTLTPAAQTGTTTITASAPIFTSADAGSLIQITQGGQFQTASFTSAPSYSSSIKVSGSGVSRTFAYAITGVFVGTLVLQKAVGSEVAWVDVSTFTATTSVTNYNDGLDGQIIYYRWKMSAYTSGTAVCTLTYSGGITYGTASIYSVDLDNQVTVDVYTPFASTAASSVWARGSWSDRNGWPNTVALFDGRLSFRRDDKRWQSASDDFENFLLGALDADSISGSIPGQLNKSRWLKAGFRLMTGSQGAEGYISTSNFDEVMTPNNVRARNKSTRGSADADALVIDTSIAFINRSSQKVMLLEYAESAYQTSYAVSELSRLHRDISGAKGAGGGFVELAYQQEPERRIWAVRQDGQIAVQIFYPDEKVAAYSRLIPAGTNAKFESVCVLSSSPEDDVYRSVARTINGSTKRYVEKLATERWALSSQATYAWRLECAIEYKGNPTSTITGLSHLEGQSVYAWGNGRKSGPWTVASGQITLDYAVTYAIVGLLYQGLYKGPRFAGNGQQGSPLTQYSKIDRIGLLVVNTIGGGISYAKSLDDFAGGDSTHVDTLPDRTATDTFDSPIELLTEDFSLPIAGSWDKDHRLCLRFNGAGPSSVLAYAIAKNINER